MQEGKKHKPKEKRAEGNQNDIHGRAYIKRRCQGAGSCQNCAQDTEQQAARRFSGTVSEPRGREKTACTGQQQNQSGKGERNYNCCDDIWKVRHII